MSHLNYFAFHIDEAFVSLFHFKLPYPNWHWLFINHLNSSLFAPPINFGFQVEWIIRDTTGHNSPFPHGTEKIPCLKPHLTYGISFRWPRWGLRHEWQSSRVGRGLGGGDAKWPSIEGPHWGFLVIHMEVPTWLHGSKITIVSNLSFIAYLRNLQPTYIGITQSIYRYKFHGHLSIDTHLRKIPL